MAATEIADPVRVDQIAVQIAVQIAARVAATQEVAVKVAVVAVVAMGGPGETGPVEAVGTVETGAGVMDVATIAVEATTP